MFMEQTLKASCKWHYNNITIFYKYMDLKCGHLEKFCNIFITSIYPGSPALGIDYVHIFMWYYTEALQRADPLSKESYQISKGFTDFQN